MINSDTSQLEKKTGKIFLNRTNIDFIDHGELRRDNFFGFTLEIPPREIFLVLLDLEKEFNTKIPMEFVLEKRFSTFQNVIELLESL